MGGDPHGLTAKEIGKRMKTRGLGRLRWYCQVCQKQCGDELGFARHGASKSHTERILEVADRVDAAQDAFSTQFADGMTELLRTRYNGRRVALNQVYQDYIADRHHIHMNATRWVTLADFAAWLGREAICHVDQTERGWWVRYIDRSADAVRKRDLLARRERLVRTQEQQEAQQLSEALARAAAAEAAAAEAAAAEAAAAKAAAPEAATPESTAPEATGLSSSAPEPSPAPSPPPPPIKVSLGAAAAARRPASLAGGSLRLGTFGAVSRPVAPPRSLKALMQARPAAPAAASETSATSAPSTPPAPAATRVAGVAAAAAAAATLAGPLATASDRAAPLSAAPLSRPAAKRTALEAIMAEEARRKQRRAM